jgi:tetratricopeptide (TPR) repeat protein
MSKREPITWFIILMLILPFEMNAQDVTAMLKDAQQMEASFKENEALQKYLEILRHQPGNITALCKTSELYSILGKRQSTKDKQKEYYRTAKTYAQKALQSNAGSSEANFVMSVAMGRMAMIASGEDKIKAIKDVKAYAEKSVQLDAGNFKSYHVLGKWYYEVSDLNAFEKWLVKVTYEALPKATLDEAIVYYEKSRQLNPGFALNYLELAKAWKRKGNIKKGIELLDAMMKLPNTFSDDAKIKEQGKQLLNEWKK